MSDLVQCASNFALYLDSEALDDFWGVLAPHKYVSCIVLYIEEIEHLLQRVFADLAVFEK